MAAPAQQLHMTLAEFLKWDDGTDTLYELVDGCVVAMAPPRDAHGTIVANLVLALGPALRAPCRMVGNAGVVLPDRDDRYYVADLVMTCDRPANQRGFLPEPRLIIEVLSQSTAAHDRGVKGEDYRQLPTVEEILFVSHDQRRVVLLRREAAQWVIKDFIGDASVELASVGTIVPLAAIYANVDVSEPPAARGVRRARRSPPDFPAPTGSRRPRRDRPA